MCFGVSVACECRFTGRITFFGHDSPGFYGFVRTVGFSFAFVARVVDACLKPVVTAWGAATHCAISATLTHMLRSTKSEVEVTNSHTLSTCAGRKYIRVREHMVVFYTNHVHGGRVQPGGSRVILAGHFRPSPGTKPDIKRCTQKETRGVVIGNHPFSKIIKPIKTIFDAMCPAGSCTCVSYAQQIFH